MPLRLCYLIFSSSSCSKIKLHANHFLYRYLLVQINITREKPGPQVFSWKMNIWVQTLLQYLMGLVLQVLNVPFSCMEQAPWLNYISSQCITVSFPELLSSAGVSLATMCIMEDKPWLWSQRRGGYNRYKILWWPFWIDFLAVGVWIFWKKTLYKDSRFLEKKIIFNKNPIFHQKWFWQLL